MSTRGPGFFFAMDFASQSSTGPSDPAGGLHVAIVLDGNGRWAERRGLPRCEGHRAGARAVERVVAAAPGLGIGTLSLFGLSAANWRRPPEEVEAILALLEEFFRRALAPCVRSQCRLEAFGRRDRLPGSLVRAIEAVEAATAGCARLRLRVAVDYSAREAIVRAARRFHVEAARDGASTGFARLLSGDADAREVDLMIRTGGEQRLSDFLLWESAWAELVFLRRAWPDFRVRDLERALERFRARERRYGGPSPTSPTRIGTSIRKIV